jgi:oligosaccharide repeat unit polymerase
MYNTNKPRTLRKISNVKLFNLITTVYFFVFIGILVIFAEDIVFRIAFGDLGELRDMQYAGELTNAQEKFTGPLRYLSTVFTLLGDGASFMIVFFFYSICALNNSVKKNVTILLSSLSPVVLGFITIDRSKTTFWIILFVLSFIMFRQYIPKEQKVFLRSLGIVLFAILGIYLFGVTISRFGDMNEGAGGGALSYIGQPYLNFCEIWNKVNIQEVHTERVLPFTNFILGNDISKIGEDIRAMSNASGVHLNVFFSFVGMFLVDLGQLAAIFIPFLLFLLMISVVNKIQGKNYTNLYSFTLVFGFATILGCGIITYFYTTMARTISFFLFLFLSKRIK